MCVLCTEWQKGTMTNKEALAAIGEIVITETDHEKRDHLFNLANRVVDKEEELTDSLDIISMDDLKEEENE